jgi:hypothetical protein
VLSWKSRSISAERHALQRRAHGRTRVADQHVDLARRGHGRVDAGLIGHVEP